MRKELLPNSRFATTLNKTISLFIFQSTHFCDISIINDFQEENYFYKKYG